MKQIIVVEDDAGTLEIVDIILPENYRVTCFENATAIVAGLSHTPDLFIVDYRLPGYIGWRCAGILKIIHSLDRYRY